MAKISWHYWFNKMLGAFNLEDDITGLGDLLEILKRRWRQGAWLGIILLLVALVVAVLLPSKYQSTATILIEQQEIPSDLVRTTVTSYADQRIQMISQRVLSTNNLSKIVKKYGLYQEQQKNTPLNTLLFKMREQIKIEMVSADVVDPRSGRPVQATIAFTVSFTNPSPERAQQVANELVSLFMEENFRARTQIAQQASDFLNLEAKKLGEQIDQHEKALAQFKARHPDNLPEHHPLNRQILERSQQQYSEVQRQIQLLSERALYLNAEMSQLSPEATLVSETGERILSRTERLKLLQAEQVRMASRYSPSHPDRLRVESEINALRAQLGGGVDVDTLNRRLSAVQSELTALLKRYSAEHPDVKAKIQLVSSLKSELHTAQSINVTHQPVVFVADNPAYLNLKTQLDAVTSEKASLVVQMQHLSEKLAQYEQRLLAAPNVEQEYRNLSRDYENVLSKFRELKSRQMEADMSTSMEVERKGERLSLIEPPLLPIVPVSPNRPAIALLGFVLSIGVAVGYMLLRENIDPNLYGTRVLTRLTGAPPLAVIPIIQTPEEKKKRFKVMGMSVFSRTAATLLLASSIGLPQIWGGDLWLLFERTMGV